MSKTEDEEDIPLLVDVQSGEELARAVHAAAIEIAPAHGFRTTPIPFDQLPPRQREFLVAAMELALRRRLMEQDAKVRIRRKHVPAAKSAPPRH